MELLSTEWHLSEFSIHCYHAKIACMSQIMTFQMRLNARNARLETAPMIWGYSTRREKAACGLSKDPTTFQNGISLTYKSNYGIISHIKTFNYHLFLMNIIIFV